MEQKENIQGLFNKAVNFRGNYISLNKNNNFDDVFHILIVKHFFLIIPNSETCYKVKNYVLFEFAKLARGLSLFSQY